jgi:imidazolonepropionase-like amidohydrolase
MSEFIAVKGGTLIDCTGAPPMREGVVLVQSSRILDVGTAKDVDIPKGAEVIDAKGRTVMPGLMDLHIHILGLEIPY